MPQIAKKFVDEAFAFFDNLSDETIVHKPCSYSFWKSPSYRCVTHEKKYVVAYLSQERGIIIL